MINKKQQIKNFLIGGVAIPAIMVGGVFALVSLTDYLERGGKARNKPGISDSDLKFTGRQRLESKLKDPASLQIIEERIERREGKVGYWCKYRAKNGFGGYSVEEFYTE